MSETAQQYVVTAQNSTAVTSCTTGNFTSPKELNLILAKNTRLEIYLVTPEGLRLLKEFGIFGKIAVLKLFRQNGDEKDRLFIVTARYNAMILECQFEQGKPLEIVTVAHGNVGDRECPKPSETGIVGIIDPEGRVIGLKLYENFFKIIPLSNTNVELTGFNIRLEEQLVQDMGFLYGCVNPTIVMIHQDVQGRHLRAKEISLNDKDFSKIVWKQEKIESHSSIVIPIPQPFGGSLVIGKESILYYNGSKFLAVAPAAMKQSTITCYARVDSVGSRFLLGDMVGNLYMLLLEEGQGSSRGANVKSIKFEILGEISIPECLTYLDNCVVFVGSRLGDSQLIRLRSVADEQKNYISVMDSFPNLAPIIDMVVVDTESECESQLITCSGGFKEGSLRIVRNGIAIQELATIDLEQIKGLWSLSIGDDSGYENMLVVSSIGITRCLQLNGEEIEESEVEGFLTDKQTLWISNVNDGQVVQVTSSGIRLVKALSKKLLTEWKPVSGEWISVASANKSHIVCGAGAELYYLEIGIGTLRLLRDTIMENEIACLDITPNFVAVGLWIDFSVLILTVPNLEIATKEVISGDIIPRSILMVSFNDHAHYLMCSLGDGSLCHFSMNLTTGELADMKKVTLGTQPTILKVFKHKSLSSVFVCTDTPTVIFWASNRLVFSKVNLKDVLYMCPLNTLAFPNSLALGNESGIIIGVIEEIQKLQIRTVPLRETPRRIAYQESSKTFGVITMRIDIMKTSGLTPMKPSASTFATIKSKSSPSLSSAEPSTSSSTSRPLELGEDTEVHNLLIIDCHTFEVVHAHQFLENEYAISIVSCKLGEELGEEKETEEEGEELPQYYYVVGTAFVIPEESEPKRGRIVIFQFVDGKLQVIAEKIIQGACYSIESFHGKIVAGINSTVRLFKWTSENELDLECSYFNMILSLYIKCKGDFILVGDLMRSITLLKYENMTSTFAEIGRDYNPNWMTAIDIIDDDIFLGSDNSFNLMVCTRDESAPTDEERCQLHENGRIHIGDMINCIRHGSFVKTTGTWITGGLLFGTISGSIGFVTRISSLGSYEFLQELQEKLRKFIKPVGKIEHSFWRSFYNEKKQEPCEGIVDGDLIESFLNLSIGEKRTVVGGLMIDSKGSGMKEQATVEEVIKMVEDLAKTY